MNDKKSPFGDLCHQYRGKIHLSEQEMGKKIEELGYKLGKDKGKNKQPLISQFERKLEPEGPSRTQHRDPPLDYVEVCARVFKLAPPEKYDLFIAALQSSEKLVFDRNAIDDGEIEKEIISIVLSLILSGKKLGNIVKNHKENKQKSLSYTYPENDDDRKYYLAWEKLLNTSQEMIEIVRNNHFSDV